MADCCRELELLLVSYQCSLSFWNSILNYPNELWVATEAYYVLHIRAQQHTCIIMYKLYKYKGFNVHISGYIYRERERDVDVAIEGVCLPLLCW